MVNVCFQQAARASEQPDDVWLSAADVLAEDADRDFSFVRIITAREKENEEQVDAARIEREKLEKKRQYLVQLIQGALPILRLINEHLEGTESQTDIPKRTKANAKSSPKPRRKRKAEPKKTKRSVPSGSKKKS